MSHTSTVASAASDPKNRRRIVHFLLRPERTFDARAEFTLLPLSRYANSEILGGQAIDSDVTRL